MNKTQLGALTNLARFGKNTVILAKKNAPQVLTVISNISTIGAVVFAIRATPKALLLIDEATKAKGEELTTWEKVKACGKVYVPAAVMTGVAIGSSIGATKVSLKRNAALAGLYSASEIAMKEYQDKVVEVIGEKKEKEVQQKIAEDKVQEAAARPHTVLETGRGNNLYYDEWNGRFFRSSQNDIEQCAMRVAKWLISGREPFVGLNTLWAEMNLPQAYGSKDYEFTPERVPMFEFFYHEEVDGEQCTTIMFKPGNTPKHGSLRIYE